ASDGFFTVTVTSPSLARPANKRTTMATVRQPSPSSCLLSLRRWKWVTRHTRIAPTTAAAGGVVKDCADTLGLGDDRVAGLAQVDEELLGRFNLAVAVDQDGDGLGRFPGSESEDARLADEVAIARLGGPVRGGVPDAHLLRTGFRQAHGKDKC